MTKESICGWIGYWDSYDHQNNSAMVQLLMDACDKSMRSTITPYIDQEDLPVVVLLVLICSELKHTTLLTYDIERKEVMAKKPTAYTGIDIKKFCKVVRPYYLKLEKVWQFNQTVHIDLLKKFINLKINNFSGKVCDKFFDPTIDAYNAIGDVTQAEMMRQFRLKKLHWENVLERATSMYCNMVAAGHWPAAKSKDGKTPPEFYAAETGDSELQREFAVFLLEKKGGKKPFHCFGCGKVGVKKPDCPDCIKKAAEEKKTGTVADKSYEKALKEPAPKSNEPHTKIIADKIHFYCKGCT